jgi:hypothetical protein
MQAGEQVREISNVRGRGGSVTWLLLAAVLLERSYLSKEHAHRAHKEDTRSSVHGAGTLQAAALKHHAMYTDSRGGNSGGAHTVLSTHALVSDAIGHA